MYHCTVVLHRKLSHNSAASLYVTMKLPASWQWTPVLMSLLLSGSVLASPTAFDLTVTSPLNPSIHSEVGSVAVVRKHLAKYIHKCSELGWTCISPNGAWGKEVASITPCH